MTGSFAVQALLASIIAGIDSMLPSCSSGQRAIQCGSPAGLAGQNRYPGAVAVPDRIVPEGCCRGWEHATPADKRCGRAAPATVQRRPQTQHGGCWVSCLQQLHRCRLCTHLRQESLRPAPGGADQPSGRQWGRKWPPLWVPLRLPVKLNICHFPAALCTAVCVFPAGMQGE